ncbi:hypothetical protein GQ457_07G005320 [Hibiscus cannabinus]
MGILLSLKVLYQLWNQKPVELIIRICCEGLDCDLILWNPYLIKTGVHTLWLFCALIDHTGRYSSLCVLLFYRWSVLVSFGVGISSRSKDTYRYEYSCTVTHSCRSTFMASLKFPNGHIDDLNNQND